MGPMDVFDLGRFAVLADPSGAVFSLWQARSFAGAAVFNAPGSLGWVELATRDAEGAKRLLPRGLRLDRQHAGGRTRNGASTAPTSAG